MEADDAHGYPALHTTAVRTWHRAAMAVIVVGHTDQIQMSANTNTHLGGWWVVVVVGGWWWELT